MHTSYWNLGSTRLGIPSRKLWFRLSKLCSILLLIFKTFFVAILFKLHSFYIKRQFHSEPVKYLKSNTKLRCTYFFLSWVLHFLYFWILSAILLLLMMGLPASKMSELMTFCCFLKFIYSEKATKFCEISALLLSYVGQK